MRRPHRRALGDFQVIISTREPVRERTISKRNALFVLLAVTVHGQQTYSWEQLRDKFLASTPALKAARMNVEEWRATEIAAYVRPNPEITGTFDQMNFFSTQPPPNGNGRT